MTEPVSIVCRRPKYWEIVGMKGIAISAPNEYIAFNKPRRDELGWSKSAFGKFDPLAKLERISPGRKPTLNPRIHSLQTVHHGRIKARSPLNSECGWNQDEVEKSQSGFLIPSQWVGLRDQHETGINMLFLLANNGHGRIHVCLAGWLTQMSR